MIRKVNPNHTLSVEEMSCYYQETESTYNLNTGTFFLNTSNHNLPPHFPNGLFNFFYLNKINGEINFRIPVPKNPELNSRRDNIIKAINAANEKYSIPDFSYVIVGYDDRPVYTYMFDEVQDTRWCNIPNSSNQRIVLYHPEAHTEKNLLKDFSSRNTWYPVLSPCTGRNMYSETIPDFVYHGWEELNVDYNEITTWLLNYRHPPETNLMGWRGSDNSARELNTRAQLCAIGAQKGCDFKFINHVNSNTENFMTIKDMVKKWRYLIDVPGFGYSGRVKILLHAPRVLFIAYRDYQEDFYQLLKPWKHFVPLSSDLTDFEHHLSIIQNNPELEAEIIANAQEFSRTYLTQEAAIKRMSNVFGLVNQLK
jgi:hypothetical protein